MQPERLQFLNELKVLLEKYRVDFLTCGCCNGNSVSWDHDFTQSRYPENSLYLTVQEEIDSLTKGL